MESSNLEKGKKKTIESILKNCYERNFLNNMTNVTTNINILHLSINKKLRNLSASSCVKISDKCGMTPVYFR